VDTSSITPSFGKLKRRADEGASTTVWPNTFSRFIGDKAFGLAFAHLMGLPVPATTIIAREIAPFTFGQSTGSHEYWIRTCPREQVPGRFSTYKGWHDPFRLASAEDPNGVFLASILSQESVQPLYSGALITTSTGKAIFGRSKRPR
jgi:hypothetical protein